jgi:N-acetylglutamate synthase-like GNAT family acetyltransferase
MPTVSVKFRRANPADKEVIQRISADAYTPAYMVVLGTIPKPATEDYGTRIEKGEVWILEAEDEPTGVAVLEERADHLLVYSVAVKPDAQRKGYGTALLDFADQRAIGLGLREVRYGPAFGRKLDGQGDAWTALNTADMNNPEISYGHPRSRNSPPCRPNPNWRCSSNIKLLMKFTSKPNSVVSLVSKGSEKIH